MKNSYVSFELHHLVTLLDKYADLYLKEHFNISYSRFLVLVAIAELQSTTQHDIAQKIFVGDAVVSRMLPSLVDMDLVTVSIDPHHRRKSIVQLTATGESVVHKSSKALEHEFLALADGSGVDVAQLRSSIGAMMRVLQG